ncbi:MAG: type II toxin-antitoxin system VapC family toxin [Deltaproteobacteria bacterium]|nr:type II toxin-antitoxin system VapC family toxin [Deltaproteobacteria bacterium]
MKIILDTHIILWWFEDTNRLSKKQKKTIENADQQNPLLISDISLWEIATLYELGRIKLKLPLRDWLMQAFAPPLVRLCGITAAIAATVASLPESFNRDPADRIITATALVHGATLVTNDERIIRSKIVSIL